MRSTSPMTIKVVLRLKDVIVCIATHNKIILLTPNVMISEIEVIKEKVSTTSTDYTRRECCLSGSVTLVVLGALQI